MAASQSAVYLSLPWLNLQDVKGGPSHTDYGENGAREEEKKKKKFTSFGQPTSLIACGRASATLPNVIRLCQTKRQWPVDRGALSTPYA